VGPEAIEHFRDALSRVIPAIEPVLAHATVFDPKIEFLPSRRYKLAHRFQHPVEHLQPESPYGADGRARQSDVPADVPLHGRPLDLNGQFGHVYSLSPKGGAHVSGDSGVPLPAIASSRWLSVRNLRTAVRDALAVVCLASPPARARVHLGAPAWRRSHPFPRRAPVAARCLKWLPSAR